MTIDHAGEQDTNTLLQRSRALRRNSTDAEKALWRLLRSRQLEGLKFRRQHPYDHFILDFFCIEQSLAVEVDGGQHHDESHIDRDEARTRHLAEKGVRVLRFTNIEVLREPSAVLEAIMQALERTPSP